MSLQTVLILLSLYYSLLQVVKATDRPIIGILCHEIDDEPPDCYIAASYVKAVEASGARVVPIFLSKEEDYYKKLVDSVNGIVFPGGDAKATTAGGYFDAARYIFNYTRQLQAEGDNFPILGVCLGLEVLVLLSNNDYYNNRTLDTCSGMNGAMLPLEMTTDFRNSSLYGNIQESLVNILTKQNVTANFHSYCVRPGTNLRLPWHILSLNADSDGKEFISSMELEGPTAAIIFHPEKNAWEWQKKHPSYKDGLLAARHFYDWLVIEARKNNHSFTNIEEEDAALIYNYSPEFSGPKGSVFTQKYIWK